jgi:3,4-dihydroxy 2-butanone 4-phosphate synthase/GTP cyclohydrolase II
MITVADLIAYRRRTERLVERIVSTNLPTAYGEFTAFGYRALIDEKHHVAMVKGEVSGKSDVLVRVHSECLTGDVFGSRRCDCGDQLRLALAQLQQHGGGIILYLEQEGRGLGLANKMRTYQMQDEGLDTIDANTTLGFDEDERDYGAAARMLQLLDCTSIILMTNNPAKLTGLAKWGIEIAGRLPIEAPINVDNRRYLTAKAARAGHRLNEVLLAGS